MKKILTAIEKLKNHHPKLEVFFQFVREFWIPLSLTGIWLLYEYMSGTSPDWKTITVQFFSIGWIFQQWGRIAKQQKTEKGLSTVEVRLSELVTKMEVASREIEGFSTGGDSYCWIAPGQLYPLVRDNFVVHHFGRFPLRNVQLRLVDLDRFSDPEDGPGALYEEM